MRPKRSAARPASSSSGLPGRRPRSASGCIRPARVRSICRAMRGAESSSAEAWSATTGASSDNTSRAASARETKERRIATGRGKNRERARTGNESTRASAKPPAATSGTAGAAYARSVSRTMAARTNKVRTRAGIQIGAGRRPPRPGPSTLEDALRRSCSSLRVRLSTRSAPSV